MDNRCAPVAITGMGIVCSIAQNIPDFAEAIRLGSCGITRLPDRKQQLVKIGAPVRNFSWQDALASVPNIDPAIQQRAGKVLRNATDSTRLSAISASQAYQDAQLFGLDESNLGILIAGSNLSQSYVAENWTRFSNTGRANPRYALSFFDSHQIGCLSEILSIRGPGATIGAGAASSNAALYQAFHLVRSGAVKRCLVVGASMDLSELELEAFAVLGAACSGRFADDPLRACRPFDQAHEGFVWGQGSASIVLESPDYLEGRTIKGEIVGASLLLDGNHLPDPSVAGELRAMEMALAAASLSPSEIGYLNAHGSSSPLGDRTECAAIRSAFNHSLSELRINSTKSLTGHCFSASGTIELIASLLQLNLGFLHPNRNLDHPIDPVLRFAQSEAEPLSARYALSNGFGFGGISSTIALKGSESCRSE